MPSFKGDDPRSVIRLADDQFEELVRLLTPGFIMATQYLKLSPVTPDNEPQAPADQQDHEEMAPEPKVPAAE